MWKPTEFWYVEEGKLIKYLREGECCKCGECCKGFKVSYERAIGNTVRNLDEDGNDVYNWANYEGWSVFYAQGIWWYFKVIEVEEDGATCCEALTASGECSKWFDEEEFKPICRYWPFHPKDIKKFPSCTFRFRLIEEKEEEDAES